MISAMNSLAIAAMAALIATAGDLILLYIGVSQQNEPALAQIRVNWLWIGGILGTIAIPFYGVGYHGIAKWLSPVSCYAARIRSYLRLLRTLPI